MHRSFICSFVRSSIHLLVYWLSQTTFLLPFSNDTLEMHVIIPAKWKRAHFVLINNNKETNTSIAIETKYTFPNNILNGLGVILMSRGDLCLIHFDQKIWLKSSGQLIDEATQFQRYFYGKNNIFEQPDKRNYWIKLKMLGQQGLANQFLD